MNNEPERNLTETKTIEDVIRSKEPMGLRPWQEEQITKIRDRIRPEAFKTEQAQAIYEHWLKKAPEVSSKIKDEIGKLWLTEVIGVSEETANNFIKGDLRADLEIGYLQTNIIECSLNMKDFWYGVEKLSPNLFSNANDIEYLTQEERDCSGAFTMIDLFQNIGSIYPETYSPVLASLSTNAIAFRPSPSA